MLTTVYTYAPVHKRCSISQGIFSTVVDVKTVLTSKTDAKRRKPVDLVGSECLKCVTNATIPAMTVIAKQMIAFASLL